MHSSDLAMRSIWKWLMILTLAAITAFLFVCVFVCVKRYLKYRRKKHTATYRYHPQTSGDLVSGEHGYGQLQDVTSRTPDANTAESQDKFDVPRSLD